MLFDIDNLRIGVVGLGYVGLPLAVEYARRGVNVIGFDVDEAKVEALNRLTGEHGLGLADAMAVGDGANDIAMLQAAGMGVAMHAKPAVRETARFVIDHGDLTALLYIQGYRKADFVQ